MAKGWKLNESWTNKKVNNFLFHCSGRPGNSLVRAIYIVKADSSCCCFLTQTVPLPLLVVLLSWHAHVLRAARLPAASVDATAMAPGDKICNDTPVLCFGITSSHLDCLHPKDLHNWPACPAKVRLLAPNINVLEQLQQEPRMQRRKKEEALL